MINVKYIYDWQNKSVNEYTISNGIYKFSALNIGASLTKLIVPNKNKKLENIILRYYDYKLYKENKYLLGCLVNIDKMVKREACALNYYFDCIFNDHSLTFLYEENDLYIKIKYMLNNNVFSILYDSNISMSQVVFFNLTGNAKDNVLGHKLSLNNNPLLIENSQKFFKKYCVEQDLQLNMFLNDNGVELNVESENNDLYLSFGEYFNEKFFVNKRVIANEYSGIGIVVDLNEFSKYVSYQFS